MSAAPTLRSTDLRALSQGERGAVFFFAVFPGNHSAMCLAAYMQTVTGRPVPPQAANELVRNLALRGILAEGVAARDIPGTVYRLEARFTLGALRLLAADAEKYGWWPDQRVCAAGDAGAWLGAELAFAVRNFVSPVHVWQAAETMRILLGTGDPAMLGTIAGARYPVASPAWCAVTRVLGLLDPGEPVPADDLPPQAVDRLLGTLLEQGFLLARDVRPLLESARGLLAAPGARPSAALLCAYCALCVWTGRRDLLAGVATAIVRGSPAEAFAALCLDAFDGRFAEAERAFSAGFNGFRAVYPEDVSTPVWLLGMALAMRVDAPLTRIARAAKELANVTGATVDWHPFARAALREAERIRAALVGAAMDLVSAPRPPSADADPLAAAKRLYLAGYPTRAALRVAALCRTKIDLPKLDGFRALLVANGAVPLAKSLVRDAPWRIALRELAACLPASNAAAKGETALSGTIGWALAFTAVPREDETLYACARLAPVYRGPRGAADGRDDRRLTLKALASAKYRACLTSVDAEALQTLQRLGYNPRVSHSVPDEVLQLLCGHPRLMLCGENSALADGDPRTPIALERRPCELTTSKGPNGEMRLELPAWIFNSPQTAYAIRRADEGRYLYHALPKRIRDVAAVFAANGEGGRLELPAEAVKEAEGVLARLAGVLQVGGAFAVGTDGAFARTAGDPTPHVRLVYSNDALSLALVVEPLPNRGAPACEPGVGLAERLVQLRGGRTVLLARDLAAEEAGAGRVRGALAGFDAWATGRNRWLVTDAEQALEALRIVRGLEDVRLDWPEGEKVRVAAPSAGGVKIEASGTDWFALEGEVAFDDGRVVALMDLLRALENREGNFVRFGENDYLYLSSELLRRMEALATVVTSYGDAEGRSERTQISSAAVPMLAQAFDDGAEGLPGLPAALAARADAIRAAFAEPVEVPRRFRGRLRSYQETGYAWLEHLAACGFGACLADDMGLGKTVQVIALLLNRAAAGVSLVVAPASVCANWVREIERFAPTLRPVTRWGEKALPSGLGVGDVVVASYGLLVSRGDDFAVVDWNGVVLDEAQAVKNAATRRAHAAQRLRARFRVAATGTPVENRLAEFWSIFSFLNPGLLGTAREFEARFTEAGFVTKALKRIVEPFVLRRLKRDVLRELPEKTEVTLRVTLGEEERAAYEACRRSALEGLKARGETENRVSILAALTRLRRFCCHPSLVVPALTASAKLDAVLELLGQLREGGHRALVFSQFVDHLSIVRAAVESRGWTYRYLDGATPPADRLAAVDAFQRGDGDFFLISLKAGGTGLNLTAANYVLLLDPWWNPAVEDQAADRVHRIGQKLPVTVYRVVAEDTVEDRILDLHGDKRAVSADLLESARGLALTPERLMSLFEE